MTRASRKTQRPSQHRAPLVLIAEDNDDQREMYASYFRFQGVRVETVADGAAAYERATAINPDAIVMDLAMPLLDGYEATRRLKARQPTATIPIIACTGHVGRASVEKALDAGCDAFVAKPCLPQDLLSEVRRVLDRFGKTPR
jgi:two-component system, cell cycle response regulator DivK